MAGRPADASSGHDWAREPGIPTCELSSSDLTALGYQVDYRILDATAYGIPQRRRLFVVGMAPGRAFTWPPATYGPGTSRAVPTAGEVISADITVGDPNPSKVTYAKNPVIRPSPFAGLLFNGGGRPLNLAAPVPTVLASVGWNRTPWIDTAGILPEYHAYLREGGTPRAGVVPGARDATVVAAQGVEHAPIADGVQEPVDYHMEAVVKGIAG